MDKQTGLIMRLLAEQAAGLSAFDIAVALSLYGYNVSAGERAKKIYDHFRGECAELDDLISTIGGRHAAYIVTELATPSAALYVLHALERYGAQAAQRNRINLAGIEALL